MKWLNIKGYDELFIDNASLPVQIFIAYLPIAPVYEGLVFIKTLSILLAPHLAFASCI